MPKLCSAKHGPTYNHESRQRPDYFFSSHVKQSQAIKGISQSRRTHGHSPGTQKSTSGRCSIQHELTQDSCRSRDFETFKNHFHLSIICSRNQSFDNRVKFSAAQRIWSGTPYASCTVTIFILTEHCIHLFYVSCHPLHFTSLSLRLRAIT